MLRWFGIASLIAVPALAVVPVQPEHHHKGKVPVAEGFGGAVATVDHDATKAGISVLRKGGNAVDAAVASAATLGVTEPFSAGFGGGGFFVYYDAKTGQVHTIDGREKAPASATDELFLDPDTGDALPFDDARYSGRSVGVPGTPATWESALRKWGTWSLSDALKPATGVAEKGFEVDPTFVSQIQQNADFFDDFTSTRSLYLPGGKPPAVGSTFRNPDMAGTYRLLGEKGVEALYGGELGTELVDAVRKPPVADDADREVLTGDLTPTDMASYATVDRDPTKIQYRGLDVYGMAPPSSGGSTVGEALNMLEGVDLSDKTKALHAMIESAALSFADRNRYVGDPAAVEVPLSELLSQGFADERRCQLKPDAVLPKPVDPGVPDGDYDPCGSAAPGASEPTNDGQSTTHLTVADKWGNVVAYTLTIEGTGGSGIVVPDRGYLLNNELTDFNFEPTQGSAPDPNLPGPGKRPRSSMTPTIVLEDGKPKYALGSPGGATIITTVLQTLLNRIDLGMDLPTAVAAPRASSRNSTVQAEPDFLSSSEGQALAAMGHEFSRTSEIGTVAAIEFGADGFMQAVAEPKRRGGGSAMVVQPAR